MESLYRIHNLTKQYPLDTKGLFRKKHRFINAVDNVSFQINKGETFGVVGESGSGKTTLLRLLTGEEKPSAGEVELSPRVRIGYFDQGHLSLEANNTLIEELQRVDDKLHEFDAKALLGRFGFASTLFKTQVKKLSGGERARLAILKLVMSPYNLLLLD